MKIKRTGMATATPIAQCGNAESSCVCELASTNKNKTLKLNTTHKPSLTRTATIYAASQSAIICITV